MGVNTSETEFNTVNKTGGDKTVTLTVAQIPSHGHTYSMRNSANPGGRYAYPSTTADSGMSWTSDKTHDTGGNQSHNNLPPYQTVFFWRRTA